MNCDNVFVIAASDYEEYIPYYLIGPDNLSQEEFERISNKVRIQAGLNLLAERSNQDIGSSQFIDGCDLIEAMMPLLEDYGFKRFLPKLVTFNSGIPNSFNKRCIGRVLPNIVFYNEQVRFDMRHQYSDE